MQFNREDAKAAKENAKKIHFFATDGAPIDTDESNQISFIGVHRCPIGG